MGVHHPQRMNSLLDMKRMIQDLVAQAMQNASFGRAGLRVYDGGWIEILNGGLKVIGTALIEGVLRGTGTFDWLGPWFLKGKGTISGNVDITGDINATGDAEFGGDTVIKQTLDVQATTRLRGETTLEDDLEVLPGGKIKVGDMVIDPTGYGKVSFGNGTEVRAGEGGVTIQNAVTQVTVAPSFVRVGTGGSGTIFDASGIQMNRAAVPVTSVPGVPPDVLVIQANGRIARSG